MLVNMRKKIPLHKQNALWGRFRKDRVTCSQCHWKGPFCDLLCEPDSRVLYCPSCTSRKWFYGIPALTPKQDKEKMT